VEDRPRALLAQRGPAHRIGGALMAAMERRPGGGWALSARQEIHPDDRDLLDVLLLWLRTRSGGGPAFRCTARFCEEESFEPLALPEPPAAARGTAGETAGHASGRPGSGPASPWPPREAPPGRWPREQQRRDCCGPCAAPLPPRPQGRGGLRPDTPGDRPHARQSLRGLGPGGASLSR